METSDSWWLSMTAAPTDIAAADLEKSKIVSKIGQSSCTQSMDSEKSKMGQSSCTQLMETSERWWPHWKSLRGTAVAWPHG